MVATTVYETANCHGDVVCRTATVVVAVSLISIEKSKKETLSKNNAEASNS